MNKSSVAMNRNNHEAGNRRRRLLIRYIFAVLICLIQIASINVSSYTPTASRGNAPERVAAQARGMLPVCVGGGARINNQEPVDQGASLEIHENNKQVTLRSRWPLLATRRRE